MPQPIPATPLPTPPNSADRVNFAPRADTFNPALMTFGDQMNALAADTYSNALAATNSVGLSATSTSSLLIGLGSKSATIQTGKTFAGGNPINIASTASPGNWMEGTVTSYDPATGAVVANITRTSGSGTFAAWDVRYSPGLAPSLKGLQSVWVPVAAMTPRITNGATSVLSETATNKHMIMGLDFDPATNKYAQFEWAMPKSWNKGVVYFTPYWKAASGTGDVVWGVQAVAMGDGDSEDPAFGTAQISTDTLVTANTVRAAPMTAGITVAGSSATNPLVKFQIYRDAVAGTDTLGVNARLRGGLLLYTLNADTDA